MSTERSPSPEELERAALTQELNGEFFLTTDLAVEKTVDLSPGHWSMVPIHLDTDDLGSFLQFPRETLGYLDAHMRSRYAQFGLHPAPFTGQHIAYSISEQEWRGLKRGHDIAVNVPVANYSTRSIRLESGDTIFGLYTPMAAERLKGASLMQAVASGEVVADGEEGRDWGWAYKSILSRTKTPDDIRGIWMRLKPERLWVPPSESTQPLSIKSNGKGPREEITTYLKDAPLVTEGPILWIGETATALHLSAGVHGVITPLILPFGKDREGERGTPYINEGMHINSLLMHPVRTNWNIKAETYSRLSAAKPPGTDTINFFFYRNKQNLYVPQ